MIFLLMPLMFCGRELLEPSVVPFPRVPLAMMSFSFTGRTYSWDDSGFFMVFG